MNSSGSFKVIKWIAQSHAGHSLPKPGINPFGKIIENETII